MKSPYLYSPVCCFVSLLLVLSSKAQILFFADFEEGSRKAVPDTKVNDPKNWKPDNAAQIWVVSDFPGNKSKALEQVAEGCGISGDTHLPSNIWFTNGIIQLEMGWKDNDSWGVTFRRSAKDKGYLVVFGSTETPAVIVAGLDKCGATGQCLDGMGCENNPANTLAQVPHGIAPRDETGNTSYFGRIEVTGDTIRVWYLKRDEVKDPFDKDLGKRPIVEVKDNRFKAGAVGIWHESNRGHIDNILVTGSGFLAVDSRGKLTTTWAWLRSR